MVPKTKSGRWLAGITGAVLALAALSIIVTLVIDDGAQQLPEGSPEHAVQRYLLAIQDREYRAAYDILGPEIQERCTFQEFEQSFGFNGQTGLRVRLDEVGTLETGTQVTVRITQIYEARPFPGESTFTQRYMLREVDGTWRLTDAPWPYNSCSWRGPIEPRPTPAPTATPTPESEA